MQTIEQLSVGYPYDLFDSFYYKITEIGSTFPNFIEVKFYEARTIFKYFPEQQGWNATVFDVGMPYVLLPYPTGIYAQTNPNMWDYEEQVNGNTTIRTGSDQYFRYTRTSVRTISGIRYLDTVTYRLDLINEDYPHFSGLHIFEAQVGRSGSVPYPNEWPLPLPPMEVKYNTYDSLQTLSNKGLVLNIKNSNKSNNYFWQNFTNCYEKTE